MGDEGLPVFNPDRCVGCGACTRACPKGIISLISSTTKILHWNQYTECLAPCQQKCPAQIDIRQYVQFVKEGPATKTHCSQSRNIIPSRLYAAVFVRSRVRWPAAVRFQTNLLQLII